ncbi:hypothetical protein [Schleiferia thermophila]|jgi:regulator of replication initiation timing|uniref:Cell division protein ZapB n=1 Tax=Schleiferia thermophila TaxID=884107 RepID=A0A369AAY3_9FLAO|nr:hypothetical protein [Schleiferia thermophila]KFD40270.1 hypothetical protein AT05_01100 [Schleiferia thermophila str. Yellowstone]PMB19051.1 hypothetical protein CEN47_23675 [Fischerella thermalis CCMEE 5319]RCX05456.1 hypothetical protein DES35_101742 [Schleiferia thermophila]GCD79042.1 hypothetical protein JCM30197_02890 [Schleiferia thermophila]
MNSLEMLVSRLKEKVEEATHLLQEAREENIRLKVEVVRLRKRVQDLQALNQNLIERQGSLQMELERTDTLTSIQTKSRINELVREIDKCLALLEQ